MSEIHRFNLSAMATPFQVRSAGEEKTTPRLRLTQLIAGRRQPKTSRFFSLVFKSPSPLLVRPAGGIKFNSPSAIKSVSLMQVAKTIFI
jgi:hypothetical protein